VIKKIIIGAALLLVLAAGLWIGGPIYRNSKQRQFLAQARDYLAKSDFTHAIFAARQTLAINPANVEANRVIAQIAENLRSDQAIAWRMKVVALEPGVLQNHLDLVRVALMLGATVRAQAALRDVPETNRNTSAYQQMAALTAIANDDVALAAAHFAQAARLDPDNKKIQFDLAVLNLQSREPKDVDAARVVLDRLRADPAWRVDALRHLATVSLRSKDYPKALEYTAELAADPNAAFEDRLMRLTALRTSHSPDFPAALAQFQTESAGKPEDINTLGSWMIANDLADPALAWLGSLPGTTRALQPVAAAMADCYAAKKDWAGLQTLLQDQNWADADFARLALVSRAFKEQKRTVPAQATWRSAVNAAGNRLPALSALFRMAKNWEWPLEQEQLLWAIVEGYPGERWALQSLNQLYLATGNTAGLQKVYVTLVQFDPTDLVAKNNLADISLLLNLQTDRAHELAREVRTRYPNDPVFASTYAFSLHLKGKTVDGLKALEVFREEDLEKPSVALTYGVLLAASGDATKAKKYLDLAETGKLLP